MSASATQLEQFASQLPEFLAARRWFRAKTRTIKNTEIADVLPLEPGGICLLIVRVEYEDGEPEYYLADFAPHGDEEKFREELLASIACNRSFPGRAGELNASRTLALPEDCGEPERGLKSVVSGAEQSNTSIVYGNRFILKLYRKLEPGINPDLEIGAFLTERGFRHTPAVLGAMEYARNDGTHYLAAILQKFVPNRGDAWRYTLDSLGDFFTRALAREEYAPTLVSYHPLELVGVRAEAQHRELFGEYLDSARLLGQRTAELHAALADPNGGPEFVPEPFTPADGEKLQREMLGHADIAFELLRRKQAALSGAAAEDARLLLRMEHRVAERFAALREASVAALQIRFHGDYHLGQVLFTGSDFMIIDFEGEPARPLSERRSKTLALRDVAGMLRSFQYAAFAALFGQVAGIPADPEKKTAVESWAAFWAACVSAAYLEGYFQTADGAAFVPATSEERRTLLDAFLLQKALYEVAYELNNRPAWVQIPMRGILTLIH